MPSFDWDAGAYQGSVISEDSKRTIMKCESVLITVSTKDYCHLFSTPRRLTAKGWIFHQT